MGTKEGLAEKEEIKVIWKLVSGELKVPALLKPVLDMALPSIIDGLDNRVGDRIPEPWQTHCENVVTMVVKAVEDKKFTQEEIEEISLYAAKVVDEKVDLPLLKDDVEAIVFIELFKVLSAGIWALMQKNKATN